MNKPQNLIAIDPDVDKSGVAFLETKTKRRSADSMGLCRFSYPNHSKIVKFIKYWKEMLVLQAERVYICKRRRKEQVTWARTMTITV